MPEVITDLAFFNGATGGSTSNCDAINDWSGAPTLDSVEFIQGGGALSAKVSKATYVSDFTLASPPVNMTGKQAFVWMASIAGGGLETIGNGGIRIRLIDSSARIARWYVAGKDTWGGAWTCFMIHADSEPTTKDSGWDKTAITAIGVTCITTRSSAYINFWWDAVRYGTYIGVKGGTEASPVTLDWLLTQEALVANKWGTCWRFEGLFLVQSKFKIGSTTSGEATYFKELGEVIIFPDRPVPVTFYDLTIQGNAGATTKVYFGEEIEGRGVSGCTFRSAGTPKATITATDTNITDLGFYGCSFFDLSTIALPPYSATRKVLSCTFEKCAEVLPDTCIVQHCNFVGADDRALRFVATNCGDYIKTNNFINCPKAVHINLAGTFLFDALMFSGNTYDIENSTAGGDVYIDRTNDSNPDEAKLLNSGTPEGTITINPLSVYLTVDVEDAAGDPIRDASVAIYKTDMTQLMNELTDVNGRAQESFQYTADTDIIMRVRKSSTAQTASRARASNIATIVTATDHRLAVNDKVRVSGLGGVGYNGDWVVASVPDSTTFTYANTGNDEGTTPDTGGTVVGPRYVAYNTTGKILSGGYTLTVVMIKDLVLV